MILPVAKKTDVQIGTGVTVAAAAMLAVSALASSLTIGLFAALPVAHLQRVRIAAGGDTPIEDAPSIYSPFYYIEASRGVPFAEAASLNAVIQNHDLNYAHAGWARPIGAADQDLFFLIAHGPTVAVNEGHLKKFKIINAPGHQAGVAIDELKNLDESTSGYIIAAMQSIDARVDGLLYKLTPDGELDTSWTTNPKVIGAADRREQVTGMVRTENAAGLHTGYLLVGSVTVIGVDAGTAETDGWWAMTDVDGNVLPEFPKTYGLPGVAERFNGAARIKDAGGDVVGYALAGETLPPPPQISGNALVLRLDQTGSPGGWTQNPAVIGAENFGESFADIIQTFERRDGAPTGFLAVGKQIPDVTGIAQAYTVRFDPSGVPDARRNQLYGGERNDAFKRTLQTFDPASGNDTGYLLLGETNSRNIIINVSENGNAYYFVRLHVDGSTIWEAASIGQHEGVDIAADLLATQGSEYAWLATGQTTAWSLFGANNIGYSLKVKQGARHDTPPGSMPFRRGDSNGDGMVDLSDAVFTLTGLFLGGTQPACEDASDADDSGILDISDAVFALNYLFLGSGLPPPSPGPDTKGPDPTDDSIGCVQYP